ncbi:hypothetical protein Tco_0751947 [Tanacetum coccineum]|uniref:Uncharacterized protein n=1 Tax=Tanacetum coccineum TaxID=301880 RepID=A0ABQ4Z734_9ASTR
MTGALQRGRPRDDIRATLGGIVGGIAGTFIGGGDTGATPGVTAPSVTREQIEGHLSALRSLVKEHNSRGNVSLIRLNFDDLEDRTTARVVVMGKETGRPPKLILICGQFGLDDFVRSEEAFTNMELPKGEVSEVFVDQGAYDRVMLKLLRKPKPRHEVAVEEHIDGLVRASSPYNVILGRTGLKTLREVSSTIHSMSEDEGKERVYLAEQVLVNPSYPDQYTKEVLTELSSSSMHTKDRLHKKEIHATDRSTSVTMEVREWLKTKIIRPVRYPTRISNPVLVKKGDRSWRMCIDFKNLNSVCSKDYYPSLKAPLPYQNIDPLSACYTASRS